MNNQSNPQSLAPQELDNYLVNGWYRMEQGLFTVDYIYIEKWIRVFWLRYRLKDFAFSKKHTQLISRCERFQVEVKPLQINTEHEELFSNYRQIVNFECPPSASQFLFDGQFQGGQRSNIFDSQMIEIRDKSRLIALGVFDQGKNSIAGILNFYHPAYRKFSFGKYLMLKKIEYAIQSGRDWYYPGYIGFDFPKFDYKLYPGEDTAEIWEPLQKQWLPYNPVLLEELTILQELFFEPMSSISDFEVEEVDFGT